jgi:hypothetical protein
LGGQSVYIPDAATWANERLDPAEMLPGFIAIERFGQMVNFDRPDNRKSRSYWHGPPKMIS